MSLNSTLCVAILLYDGVSATDAVGPHEALSCIPGARVHFVADTIGPKQTNTRCLSLTADASLAQIPHPDIVVIPGGEILSQLYNESLLAWLRQVAQSAQWITAIGVGSLLLGSAGLLKNRRATVQVKLKEMLSAFGANYVADSCVQDGTFVTAVGASAGVEMATSLASSFWMRTIYSTSVMQSIPENLSYCNRFPIQNPKSKIQNGIADLTTA
jgi:putative intracellular protease/amidase